MAIFRNLSFFRLKAVRRFSEIVGDLGDGLLEATFFLLKKLFIVGRFLTITVERRFKSYTYFVANSFSKTLELCFCFIDLASSASDGEELILACLTLVLSEFYERLVDIA